MSQKQNVNFLGNDLPWILISDEKWSTSNNLFYIEGNIAKVNRVYNVFVPVLFLKMGLYSLETSVLFAHTGVVYPTCCNCTVQTGFTQASAAKDGP
jgi:hypothetical protein